MRAHVSTKFREQPTSAESASASAHIGDDQRVLQSGSRLNALSLVVKNISPLLVVAMARLLEPADFGVFIPAQLLVLTVSRLTLLGCDVALVGWIAQNPRDDRAPEHGVAASLQLSTAATVGFILLLAYSGLIAHWASAEPSWLLVDRSLYAPCVVALLAYVPLHVLAAALEGAGAPEAKVLVNYGLVTALTPLLSVTLYLAGLGRAGLGWGFALSNLVGALVLWRWTRRVFPALDLFQRERVHPAFFARAWPLGLSEAASALVRRIDLWLVLALLGPVQSAAFSVMLLLSNGVRSIREGYHPFVVRLVSRIEHRERAERLPRIFSQAVAAVSSLQLVVSVVVVCVPDLVLAVAGRAYVVEPAAIAIVLAGHLLGSMLGLVDQVLIGEGATRPVLIANVFALGLTVGLNALLIPRFGLHGAALAGLIAQVAYGLTLIAAHYARTQVSLYRKEMRVHALCVVAFVLLALLGQPFLHQLSLLARVSTATVAALLLLVLLGPLRRERTGL